MVGAIYLLDMSVLLYNPDRKNKEEFIAEFVIRTKIFEEILADIRSGKMTTPEQHYLLLGQRGAGKTTMLLRLKYAVEDDAKLSKWLIPVTFSEEQYNIGELGNLWERIAEYMEDYYGFHGITQEIEPYIQQENYEEAALKVLIRHLDQHKKKAILFIDNIGQLLAKFSELEVHRLREILQTLPHFRLVAGSPVVLESVLDYQQPLFEFFKVIQLKGLTDEESIVLLRKLAILHHEEEKIERIIANTSSRITTLRTLSGGVPRTMVLLFQVFVDSEHGTALSDLEKVLDAVTPLYKHRMDDLPAQQQKIVDAVALHWEAISVKELAKQTRLDSKLVSAQLRQLEKNQVIEKRATKTKNHIYLLRERFFNIWYLMRYGRKQDRNRVIWLVKFLEAWCDKQEIEKRIRDYIEKARKGLLDNNTLELYGQAYTFFEYINPETKFLLKENTPYFISAYIDLNENEFYSLLNDALEKKDYDTFIKLSAGWNFLEEDVRDKFYTYIGEHLDELNESIFEKMKNAKVTFVRNGRLCIPYLYQAFVISMSFKNLIESILEQNLEHIRTVTEGLIIFIKCLDAEDIKSGEVSVFNQFVMALMAGEYYKLALKVIDSAPLPIEDMELLRRANIYLESRQNDRDVLLTLGSEMEALVMALIESILDLRTILKKN